MGSREDAGIAALCEFFSLTAPSVSSRSAINMSDVNREVQEAACTLMDFSHIMHVHSTKWLNSIWL